MRKTYSIVEIIRALNISFDEFSEMPVSEILDRLSNIDE